MDGGGHDAQPMEVEDPLGVDALPVIQLALIGDVRCSIAHLDSTYYGWDEVPNGQGNPLRVAFWFPHSPVDYIPFVWTTDDANDWNSPFPTITTVLGQTWGGNDENTRTVWVPEPPQQRKRFPLAAAGFELRGTWQQATEREITDSDTTLFVPSGTTVVVGQKPPTTTSAAARFVHVNPGGSTTFSLGACGSLKRIRKDEAGHPFDLGRVVIFPKDSSSYEFSQVLTCTLTRGGAGTSQSTAAPEGMRVALVIAGESDEVHSTRISSIPAFPVNPRLFTDPPQNSAFLIRGKPLPPPPATYQRHSVADALDILRKNPTLIVAVTLDPFMQGRSSLVDIMLHNRPLLGPNGGVDVLTLAALMVYGSSTQALAATPYNSVKRQLGRYAHVSVDDALWGVLAQQVLGLQSKALLRHGAGLEPVFRKATLPVLGVVGAALLEGCDAMRRMAPDYEAIVATLGGTHDAAAQARLAVGTPEERAEANGRTRRSQAAERAIAPCAQAGFVGDLTHRLVHPEGMHPTEGTTANDWTLKEFLQNVLDHGGLREVPTQEQLEEAGRTGQRLPPHRLRQEIEEFLEGGAAGGGKRRR